jgi:hypothetical protein
MLTDILSIESFNGILKNRINFHLVLNSAFNRYVALDELLEIIFKRDRAIFRKTFL